MDGSLDAQRAAAIRFAEIWRELLEGSARGASESLAAASGESVNALIRQAAEYAAIAMQPVRDLLEGQRDFAEHVGRWAQMQRELADSLAEWAARQQEYLDALDQMLPPHVPHS